MRVEYSHHTLVDGGVRSLLVDGTCSLARSFLEVDLVDQAVAYIESGRHPTQDLRQ